METWDDHSVNQHIFVFGSNLAGRHGAGSALEAVKNWGAINGQGVGFQGHSYAIPTKDSHLVSLSLVKIQRYVTDFLRFADDNLDLTFNVVSIGCGLAGYKPWQIAPMFNPAQQIRNVLLTPEFGKVLEAIRNS